MSARTSLFAAVIVLAAGLAGCATPGSDAANAVTQASLAPGTQADLPFAVENVSAEEESLSVQAVETSGLDANVSNVVVESGTATGWLSVEVPDDAETGSHDVQIEVDAGNGEPRTVRADLTVEEKEGIEQGKIAKVELVARTQDGKVSFTNNETVAKGAFEKTENFREPRRFAPQSIPVSQQARVPAQFVDALSTVGVNQTISVDLPETYGPEEQIQNVSRTEEVERTRTEQRVAELPRQQAQRQRIVNQSTEAGDTIEIPGSDLPYVVDNINRTKVRLELNVSQGDNVTLYDAWPKASQVVNVTEEEVTFRTDPTTEPGERFTWKQNWPNATEVVEVTNETIRLEHSPEEGLTYTERTRQGQRSVTVQSVDGDQIVLAKENPHPLAGETLTFTMTVVGQQDAPQRAQRGPGSR